MAENTSITGLLMNVFFIGLFLFSMISGYVTLVNSEGRGEIFDGFEKFEGLNLELSNNLGVVQAKSNINNNLSSTYNPELAISAADQSGNAMGINVQNITIGVWNSVSQFGGLIFGNVWTATLSELLTSILISLFSLSMVRFIRRGD